MRKRVASFLRTPGAAAAATCAVLMLTGAPPVALAAAANPPPAAAPAPPRQTIPAPPLANNVRRAMAYEAPAAQYIVANGTNIYSNHVVYGSTVVGELQRGDRVEALAKVQGYDWILVGRNGQGIGYVPISMLSPANLYVP